MKADWPYVPHERLKFLRWALRNPRGFRSYGRYARAVGLHLSIADRFGPPPEAIFVHRRDL